MVQEQTIMKGQYDGLQLCWQFVAYTQIPARNIAYCCFTQHISVHVYWFTKTFELYVKYYMLCTDINITETTYSRQF